MPPVRERIPVRRADASSAEARWARDHSTRAGSHVLRAGRRVRRADALVRKLHHVGGVDQFDTATSTRCGQGRPGPFLDLNQLAESGFAGMFPRHEFTKLTSRSFPVSQNLLHRSVPGARIRVVHRGCVAASQGPLMTRWARTFACQRASGIPAAADGPQRLSISTGFGTTPSRLRRIEAARFDGQILVPFRLNRRCPAL